LEHRALPLAFSVNRLTDIHSVEHRLESEAGAFAEISAVLKKYGLERKYGISLMHKHFDLADDEVLIEYTDIDNRILTSKPVKRGEIVLETAIETQWSLDHDNVMSVCVGFCYSNPQATPSHSYKHEAR
jgi:hypothetical protein